MRGVAAVVLAWAAGAQAYQLEHDATGTAARWDGSLTFVIDAQLAAKLNEPQTNDAIESAAKTLTGTLDGIQLDTSVAAVPAVGSNPDALDGVNEIRVLTPWPFDQTMIARTHVEFDPVRHRIIEADLLLNGERVFRALPAQGDPGSQAFDLQSIVTHELGHALGLAHNPDDREAVMYPSIGFGETSKRQLSSDDIAGLRSLYDSRPGCSASSGGPVVWLACAVLALALRRRASAA